MEEGMIEVVALVIATRSPIAYNIILLLDMLMGYLPM